MIRATYTAIITLFLSLTSLSNAFAQSDVHQSKGDSHRSIVFTSLNELLNYASDQSITLRNNTVRMEQAKKAKLAAVLGTIDVNGSLLSAQFTDNTRLGVNLFPAEIFGGEAGTFKEVQMGVRYNTNLTNYADIKLINPTGWSNLNLSKINIDLTNSNNLLTLKSLQENIAVNYYNIVNLQEQIVSTRKNLAVADTLLKITENKFGEGLVSQQDVSESRINYLNTKENISQLTFLLEQYYISLKILCDIPDTYEIEIRQIPVPSTEFVLPIVRVNEANLNNALFKEAYAKASYNSAKAAFLPSLSLQLSNSNNLYNTEFQPLSGNWINSNYVGINLNIPIPGSQRISQKYQARYEYQLAKNNTEQAKIQADLDQQSLQSEYEKSISQIQTDREILSLRKDIFFRNQNLFEEGIINLDVVLNSFNAMVNAQYNLIASETDSQLVLSKINIHNNIR